MDNDKLMSKFFTTHFLVDALLEDYANVVSKIEKTSEQEIKTRIKKRANELRNLQKNIPLK